jgi:hypothetical protein
VSLPALSAAGRFVAGHSYVRKAGRRGITEKQEEEKNLRGSLTSENGLARSTSALAATFSQFLRDWDGRSKLRQIKACAWCCGSLLPCRLCPRRDKGY